MFRNMLITDYSMFITWKNIVSGFDDRRYDLIRSSLYLGVNPNAPLPFALIVTTVISFLLPVNRISVDFLRLLIFIQCGVGRLLLRLFEVSIDFEVLRSLFVFLLLACSGFVNGWPVFLGLDNCFPLLGRASLLTLLSCSLTFLFLAYGRFAFRGFGIL